MTLRLSNLSSTPSEFNSAVGDYQEILKKSGFDEKLTFQTPQVRKKRQRKRQILWFNPPYDKQVKTPVGKTFLTLLKKHFPPHHKLHKILNKNTVKISYSCMPNIASRIAGHNKKILTPKPTTENIRTCNCRNKEECPFR